MGKQIKSSWRINQRFKDLGTFLGQLKMKKKDKERNAILTFISYFSMWILFF